MFLELHVQFTMVPLKVLSNHKVYGNLFENPLFSIVLSEQK